MSKPPMIVWLNHGDDEHEPPWCELCHEEITWSEHRTGHDFGPYVHLISLFEQVEKESLKISQKRNINPVEARGEAFKNIVRNILNETEQT